ncbi:hypothetical protein H8B13_18970 [Hymenobacter sp. BT188]|uniref:hypothetical protein n=1 Tax=Hymenobacter sp. BT188 TaxID=2763504 RepID=UPI001650EEC8|nr:hypothetical protein [Hymenobacter sp. BT188]MBC6608911.1 hypothetical protein [Hymenobacter sp. BT188]
MLWNRNFLQSYLVGWGNPGHDHFIALLKGGDKVPLSIRDHLDTDIVGFIPARSIPAEKGDTRIGYGPTGDLIEQIALNLDAVLIYILTATPEEQTRTEQHEGEPVPNSE